LSRGQEAVFGFAFALQGSETGGVLRPVAGGICGPWREEAVALPHNYEKLVLIDLSNPGRGGCKTMGAVTYPDPQVEQLTKEHFIPVQHDFAGSEWAKRVEFIRY